MSEQRKKRIERREANIKPDGFVCGNCKQYNEFDKEDPLVCQYCGYGKVDKEEEA